MAQKIGFVTLLVRDYEEAIQFFTSTLGFKLIEDIPLGDGKRWILVGPTASGGTHLLLAKASNLEQETRIGKQTGGRVFLFLHTDDFWRDYRGMKASGVTFRDEPREESYGTVAVFDDLYGNKWDLLELKESKNGDNAHTRLSMENSEEITKLLTEIRDVHQNHLEEYRAVTSRSLELQEQAVKRQEQAVKIYRGVGLVAGILIIGIIILLVYLVGKLP